MTTTELNAAAKDLLAVKTMIAELEAQAEALTDAIKGAMVEQGKGYSSADNKAPTVTETDTVTVGA